VPSSVPQDLGGCQIGVRVVNVRRRQYLLAGAQPVAVDDFLIPATIGSIAGLGAGAMVRKMLDGEHDTAKDAAAYIVNSAVFLLVGGLTFVLRQRRAH
jgi:hypothetical protein